MNSHKKFNGLMEPALYGELAGAENDFFQEHLRTCERCAAEYRALNETFGVVRRGRFSDTENSHADEFWTAIEPRLESNRRPPFSPFKVLFPSFALHPAWTYRIAGAAAILIIGFVIGRFAGTVNDHSAQQTAAVTADSLAGRQAALEYIERSKLLLLGLTNYDAGSNDMDVLNLPHQKELSKDLLVRAAEIKRTLRGPSNQELRKLVSDIELVLMQVANLDAKVGLSGIEIIKDGVKSRGIILKIYIQELNTNEKKTAPVSDTPGTDTKS